MATYSPALASVTAADVGLRLPTAPLNFRQKVLRATLADLTKNGVLCHKLARKNLAQWQQAAEPTLRLHLHVIPGDWGEVTGWATREYGQIFAVLNMANAYVPGGGYVEGLVAQEENMFRRTDCHFSLDREKIINLKTERYRPAMTTLLNAGEGRVYLDTTTPRVCVRGAEKRDGGEESYRWLADDELFLFYELRAAAVDLRDKKEFTPEVESEMQRRIDAQLDTLIAANVRHCVLSAFGCGAFRNPARTIAKCYHHALKQRRDAFDVVVFAIYHAGYGPDNYSPFKEVFTKKQRARDDGDDDRARARARKEDS